MFAINHAATALIVKKEYPTVSIIFLLVSVQLIEFLWVIFNYLGIEITSTNNVVQSVNDIHLEFMPYSHSVVITLVIAGFAWLIISKFLNKPLIGIAVSLGIISHIFLDIVTHNIDIAIVPFLDLPKLGTGLYAIPFAGLAVETLYGVGCWWYYQGSITLLLIILFFNLANISMFTASISGPETLMANNPTLITTVILVQIIVTLFLVGYFSKNSENMYTKQEN